MSNTVNRADLRELVYERADIDPAYFPPDECNRAINVALGALHLFVTSANPDYFVKKKSLAITATEDGTDLPSDVFQVRRVDVSDGGDYRRLEPFKLDDLGGAQTLTGTSTRPQFQIMGRKIFMDDSSWAGTVRLWYVPEPWELNRDGDVVPFPRAWCNFIILHVAEQYAQKAGEDPSVLMAQMRETKKLIISSVRQLRGQPVQARNIYAERGTSRLNRRRLYEW